MTQAVYDEIGKTYDTTRRADPLISNTLQELLRAERDKKYLDIACGSGNYTHALSASGMQIVGIDLSSEMLNKAKSKYPDLQWFLGDACALPFSDQEFDGATCILATHHIHDYRKAFSEAFRVIKTGNFVIFTAMPDQMRQYWLWHYFPKMMDRALQKMSSFKVFADALMQAGFKNVTRKPFFITNELQDWFLCAGKYQPEIYLDPAVRAGISSFHQSADPDELEAGLTKLKNDIESGSISQIIKQYESDKGEYLFVCAEKK